VLLLSNPIDDMGYVSSEIKVALIRCFVAALIEELLCTHKRSERGSG